MVEYLRPDVYIEEEVKQRRPIRGVGTAITGFMGIAEKGPIGKPIFVVGESDYRRVFGDFLPGQALAYSVTGFFKNGGSGAWILRLGHYTDLVNRVLAAAAASVSCDGVGIESYAEYQGSVDVTTLVLVNGWTFDLDVSGTGADTVTVQAVAATVTGAGGTFPLGGASDTAEYKIDGGPTKSITLNGIAAGIANYVNALNAQIEGASVEDSGGQLKITSDTEGSVSSIQLLSFGATFAASTGLSAGTYSSAGPNNVANADSVTFAELKAMIEAAVKTAVPGDKVLVTQESTGKMVWTVTHGSPGPTSELDLVSGTADFLSAMGVSGLGSQGGNPTATGSATAASTSLIVKAGYRGLEAPGTHGNNYYLEIVADPRFGSAGVGSDLAVDASSGSDSLSLTSLTGITQGSYLLLTEGATQEYVKVSRVETTVSGGTVTHSVYLTANLVNTFVAANSTVESQEHTLILYDENDEELDRATQVSMNPDSDYYVETVWNDTEVGSNFVMVVDQDLAFPGNILDSKVKTQLTGGTSETAGFVVDDIVGDETGKTGVYAFDEVDDINLVCAPPSFGGVSTIPANAVVHNQLLLYCGRRMDCFAITDIPEWYTYIQAKNYRNNILGADSYWGAIYYPFLEVPDPLGTGAAPTVYVPPCGYIAGLYARQDQLPDGGIASAPAGIGDFGKLRGVVGLQTLVGNREHDLLNPAGINTIRHMKKGGQLAPGIVVLGARTLSTGLEFRFVSVRRLMTYIEQSIRLGTMWAVFRDNDFRTWGKLKDQIEFFLRGLLKARQLKGRKAEEAYFVKIDDETTTTDDINEGRLIGQIAVAPQKPAEFLIFRFSQFQGGSSIEE